jgi:hypothetical protein
VAKQGDGSLERTKVWAIARRRSERWRVCVPSHKRVHVHQYDFLGKPGRLNCFVGKCGGRDYVPTKGVLFFNHALELLDSRTINPARALCVWERRTLTWILRCRLG